MPISLQTLLQVMLVSSLVIWMSWKWDNGVLVPLWIILPPMTLSLSYVWTISVMNLSNPMIYEIPMLYSISFPIFIMGVSLMSMLLTTAALILYEHLK